MCAVTFRFLLIIVGQWCTSVSLRHALQWISQSKTNRIFWARITSLPLLMSADTHPRIHKMDAIWFPVPIPEAFPLLQNGHVTPKCTRLFPRIGFSGASGAPVPVWEAGSSMPEARGYSGVIWCFEERQVVQQSHARGTQGRGNTGIYIFLSW